MSTSYTDIAAYNAQTTRAQAAAQATYQQAQAQGLGEQAALDKAKFAWQQTMDQAGLTGLYQGAPTVPALTSYANQFGTWGVPTQGEQTLAAQQQAYQQAYYNSLAYGQYYAPGSTPTAGASTLEAQNQANQLALSQAAQTGYYSPTGLATGAGQGTQTLAGQQQQFSQGLQQAQFAAAQQQLQQSNAQAYLAQLAQLRGPADWAKYQQVLGSTPNGMRDLAAAAMGQYTPGGGATTGYQPQAVSLDTMQQQIAGTAPGYGYGNQGYNQAQGSGQAWGTGIGIGGSGSSGGLSADQQQQAQGGGTNMYGAQQQQYNLPAPNQIAAQSWNNMAPSQQQMLLGQYEANGWDKNDVTALYNQSLPKYGSNSATAGTWRLQ